MSLDVYLVKTQPCDVYWANITHNLGEMATAAGIYMELWRPDEIGITKASQLIAPLEKGIKRMKRRPAKYRKFDAPNGWGVYDHFVPFVSKYLEACRENPDAEVRVSR